MNGNKQPSLIFNCPFIVYKYHHKYCGKMAFTTVVGKEVCVYYLCDGLIKCTQLSGKEKKAFLKER